MKRFLNDYGFAILAAIVVIVLVTFSSSVSSAIQKQTANTIQSLGKVANNDLNKIDDSVSLIDLTSINKSGVVGDFSRKGNLVTISGTQYRVLEVNGTQVKVVSIESVRRSKFNNSSVTVSFNGNNGQKYADSILDNTMTNYYNSLTSTIQNAIVEQNINQSMYNWYSGTSSNASFSAWSKNPFLDADTSGNNYYLKKFTDINIGTRKVYALDIDDVIAYLGSSSTAKDVNEMFFDVRNSVTRYVWLRTAVWNGSDMVSSVDGPCGSLNLSVYYNLPEVHPAFILDLSLLS